MPEALLTQGRTCQRTFPSNKVLSYYMLQNIRISSVMFLSELALWENYQYQLYLRFRGHIYLGAVYFLFGAMLDCLTAYVG